MIKIPKIAVVTHSNNIQNNTNISLVDASIYPAKSNTTILLIKINLTII